GRQRDVQQHQVWSRLAHPRQCRSPAFIPVEVIFADVVVSHISTNFDRSAFQQDPNIWFPLDRLREMATSGEIGGVSRWHYSVMGTQHHRLPGGCHRGRIRAGDHRDGHGSTRT
ncbi:MAG: hypothetical protein HOI95_01595, partial [Chromatiales bacterium]|nr:hypothetical protein [Chromatiales bacterium]